MSLAAVLAGILLASVLPGGLAGHPAFAQTTDSSILFAENGEDPVGTFRARDQDGDAIEWSLSGPDSDLFSIDEGVLSFREPPTTRIRSPRRRTVRRRGGTPTG